MRFFLLVPAICCALCSVGSSEPWRSSLYPENWQPGLKDAEGRFLHDFSYAGYHRGEKPLPELLPGPVIDVTRPPYNADRSGKQDSTAAIQAAIDLLKGNPGVVYLPAGTYRVTVPEGTTAAIQLRYSNCVLKGDGPDRTFMFLDTYMTRAKAIILMGRKKSWGSMITLLAQDAEPGDSVLHVADAGRLSPGQWVYVRAQWTPEFIAEHHMTGIWKPVLWSGPQYWRRIIERDSAAKTVRLDIPIRYWLKVRDKARIEAMPPFIEEVGIQDLSIGGREHPAESFGDRDYDKKGTPAYDVHHSSGIEIRHAANCWVRNVHTYRPVCNTRDYHLTSNGIYPTVPSSRLTFYKCDIRNPQYEGGGGNGYNYMIAAGDVLMSHCTTADGRHNFDFTGSFCSGCVIHKCLTIGGRGDNDFHMHMSGACLVDSTASESGYWRTFFRIYSGLDHGQTTTQSVFWNLRNEKARPRINYLVGSSQYGWGYVIGTSGNPHRVVTKLDTSGRIAKEVKAGTEPEDFVEGEGRGQWLVPQSLYEDQLRRRLKREGKGVAWFDVKTRPARKKKKVQRAQTPPPVTEAKKKEDTAARAEAAYEKLRADIIAGVASGKKATVYVDAAGVPTRARMLKADTEGFTVNLMGKETPIAWTDVAPSRFLAIAKKYSKDTKALEGYARANGIQ